MSEAPFGREELPYGVGVLPGGAPGVLVAIEDRVIDLPTLWDALGEDPLLFAQPSLNAFLAAGRQIWAETRSRIEGLVSDDDPRLVAHSHPSETAALRIPFEVADYVDFYASPHHATHLGQLFRPGTPPLTPNWWHLPIGYHGRSGTVVVSGTPVARPSGQTKSAADDVPRFGPSTKLDLEAELGWVVGAASTPGDPVAIERARDHLFGVVLLNDWSARDLQAWEYVPLGPFLGKSFATSISAWVLPMEALAEAAVPLPPAEQPRLPYLAGPTHGYDVVIDVLLDGHLIATCPYREMAWSPAQFVAHTTVNGAHLRTGDLLGSGTVSGPGAAEQGSLIELTSNGARPLEIGGKRFGFLEDGTEVVLRARTARGPVRRLGEVRGRISS